jgi:hypothetical protein
VQRPEMGLVLPFRARRRSGRRWVIEIQNLTAGVQNFQNDRQI